MSMPVEPSAMRWPWGDLLRAALAVEDAQQRVRLARAAGDTVAEIEAVFDPAHGAFNEIQREWGDLILGGIRVLIHSGRGGDLLGWLATAARQAVESGQSESQVQALCEVLGLTELVERLERLEGSATRRKGQ